MATLRYFMWRWQHQFQPVAANTAKRLLDNLDPKLAPDVFLVGFRTEEAEGTAPICVSPEDCRFQPDVFQGVLDLTERLAAEDPRSGFRYTEPTTPDLGVSMA